MPGFEKTTGWIELVVIQGLLCCEFGAAGKLGYRHRKRQVVQQISMMGCPQQFRATLSIDPEPVLLLGIITEHGHPERKKQFPKLASYRPVFYRWQFLLQLPGLDQVVMQQGPKPDEHIIAQCSAGPVSGWSLHVRAATVR